MLQTRQADALLIAAKDVAFRAPDARSGYQRHEPGQNRDSCRQSRNSAPDTATKEAAKALPTLPFRHDISWLRGL